MNKKIKILLSVVSALFVSGNMWYCFVCGAPRSGEGFGIYIVLSGIFSIMITSVICVEFYYICYLHKKVQELTLQKEKKEEGE